MPIRITCVIGSEIKGALLKGKDVQRGEAWRHDWFDWRGRRI